ncbi:MAG: PEP/pyruvate-binding domain-containing protein [Thermoanaerobaculia bacterium]
MTDQAAERALPRFDRRLFDGTEPATRMGEGPVGGKAAGLIRIRDTLASAFRGASPEIEVSIPTMSVVTAEHFDGFMKENGLEEVPLSGESDDAIARTFQKGDLPADLVGDLRALANSIHAPLAVRSSSLLEDALERPFAGVYATKMIPNHEVEPDARFRKLAEAVKLVWASTYFRGARTYRVTVDAGPREEKMAVLLQEVVGLRHGERYYPDISGVARSYGFYRFGSARPEDGVVLLALGLGKTIVDGGVSWTYSPAHPRASAPFTSTAALLKGTQTEFWAVNMGKPPAYDPVRETEYLVKSSLLDAEEDGTLCFTASTWNTASDRLVAGTGVSGPRVLTFAPLLVHDQYPLNTLVKSLLSACEKAAGGPVEIEFAATLDPRRDPALRLGLLQVRPMVVSTEVVDVAGTGRPGWRVLLASDHVMGNGVVEGIRDVVYLPPGRFEAGRSRAIAGEVAATNRALLEEGTPYVLIGFGRWGSADPWLGVPVVWGDVAGAKVLVETSRAERDIEMSQGSHFFHNVSSFGVSCFSLPSEGPGTLDWAWLESRPAVAETNFVRHVRLSAPLRVEVDGRVGRGIIWRRDEET